MAGGNKPEGAPGDEVRQIQEYRAAFEQSRDAIMFQDQEGFRHCNPATLAMFRVPDVATFTTLHPGDLSPPTLPDGQPSAEVAAARVEEAFDQGQAFFEWRSRTLDGVEFPSEVLLSRIDREEGPILQALVRDISHRKEAEAALRKREQELAEAQRIAQLGSWVSDFRTNEIRWSDEVYSIFGMNREEWGATLKAFMAAVHPDDRQKVQAAIDATLQGEPYDVVHRVVRPDGEVRIVRERGYAELDEDGEVVRMVGTVQDITEQRWLEDRLRRLAAILDSTPDLVGMQGPGGSEDPTLYLNAAARHYLGLPERTGSDPWEPGLGGERADLPPEMDSLEWTMQRSHPSWALEKLQNEGLPAAQKEGVWQGETAILDAQGNEVPVSQVVIAHRDESGEISQYSTIMRDISERRALEDQLRSEKALSESILASLPGIFYMLDDQGRLVQWNDQAMAVTGYGPEELEGIHARELVPEEEQDRIAESLREALTEGSTVLEAKLHTVEGNIPYLLNGLRVELEGQPYILGVAMDISERRSLEDQIRREKALSESILSGLPGVVYMLDREGRLVHWNQRVEDVTGKGPEELAGANALAFIPEEEHARVAATIQQTFEEGTTLLESKLRTIDGDKPYLFHGYRVELEGEPYVLGVSLDISELRALEDQLRREKALFGSILSGLPGIFYMSDEQGRLVQWNDRLVEVTGRSPEELAGIDRLELVPEAERDRVAQAVRQTFSEGSTLVESKLSTVAGETPYLLSGLRVELDGHPYILGVGLDISEQKRLEAALEREATTDSLTGLFNRQRFDAEINRALARHSRYGTEIALVMIDLDHFKAVNDTYGHDVGDHVLVEMAERLANAVREPDFVARWGGEEFAILLPETGAPEAYRMAERLRRHIEAEPFPKVGTLTISLGVTAFRSGDNPNTLLKRVDDALYEAKRAGRNRVVGDGEVSANGG